MIGLKKNFRWRLVFLALLFLFPSAFGLAAPAIMPIEEVKPGMHGIAKTVVSGTKIEEFGVEVLGIMKDKGPSGDLILVRTYGDLIEESGGIAQGMSGSPVYIDGKLVGAVAYGWSLTDHKTGMVTPIADMLKMLDSPSATPPLVETSEQLQPVATPLMVSGFSDRALNLLGEQLKPYSLVPYAAGEPAEDTNYPALEPGSAIGVQLVQGDVSVGAMGTVTYVDGNKLLAFGHPFLKKGNAGYYLSNAYIFTAMKGLENSFKLGVTGDAIGTVNQDRGAGIAAELDVFPSNIPVRVSVKDLTTGKTRDAFFRAVQDEQIGSILSAVGVYNIVDKTIDRVGPGTSKVSFELTAKDMPGEVLRRENMFYSPTGAAEASIAELHEALALLAGNQFHPVDIIDVNVNVEMTQERRTASILEAKANVVSVKPGETVQVTVKLKPYRSQPVIRTVAFTVPKDQPAGPLVLSVRGGGMVPLLQLLLKKDVEDLIRPEKNRQKSFEDLIKDFSSRDRNNDIVVEVMELDEEELLSGRDVPGKTNPALDTEPKPTPKRELKKTPTATIATPLKKKDEKKAKAHLTTDYIIEGDTRIVLNVSEGK
jgi:hypothetical protein